jgi:preprotein translocase subunit YajC
MNKKRIIILVSSLLAAGLYAYFLYNKKPVDIRTVSPEMNISASKLVEEFSADENAATLRYSDKVLSVSGMVSDVLSDPSGQVTVVLDSGDPLSAVSCSFYEEEAASAKSLQKGATVTIKGKCTGKLADVVLNKCSIEKNKQ